MGTVVAFDVAARVTARLLARDHARSSARRRAIRCRAPSRERRDAKRTIAPGAGVEAEVIAQTVAGAVHLALAQLPEYERRAVELAYFGGHSYRTVARMLDEPEGTVKSRIRSGLAELRTSSQPRTCKVRETRASSRRVS